MAASAFEDRTTEPSRQDLEGVLSESASLLADIERFLVTCCGAFEAEWKYYGKQAGWTIAYAHKERRVFHLIPQAGSFALVFVLGKRAVTAALDSGLPDSMKNNIEAAREYVEGRSVRLDVRTPIDVTIAKELILIKLQPAPGASRS
jgi:hypothetical protein